MDAINKTVDSFVDTPEEVGWMNTLDETDKAYDVLFHDKIVPEVKIDLVIGALILRAPSY